MSFDEFLLFPLFKNVYWLTLLDFRPSLLDFRPFFLYLHLHITAAWARLPPEFSDISLSSVPEVLLPFLLLAGVNSSLDVSA